MRLAAVIFDLDDTLLDTSALLDARDRRAWAEVYGGLDAVCVFEIRDTEIPVASLPAEVRRRAGLAVGLVTHSPARYATELLRAHSIRVDAMVTGSDGHPPKPDPTSLLAVARELDVHPGDCVYVGDSVGDFGAAAAAGMTSVGVSWNRRVPKSWRRGWPDVAVDRPSKLIALVDRAEELGLFGEVLADGREPTWHFGSVIRLGAGSLGLGRYFPMGDRRYPAHPLSHLVLDSKGKLSASEELALIFGRLAGAPMKNPPQLIVSVPPAPADPRDRFDAARALLAQAYGARDGRGLLRQLYAVDDYKQMGWDARAAKVADRFEVCGSVRGERVLLIDDVLTSGSQSAACRAALTQSGCGGVTVLVAGVSQAALEDPCPLCGEEYGGRARTKRRRSDRREFLGCCRWPSCGWSSDL